MKSSSTLIVFLGNRQLTHGAKTGVGFELQINRALPTKSAPNKRINSDWQFRGAPRAADAHPDLSGQQTENQEIKTMKNIYTAVVKKEADWWVGWTEEVPGVNCQEKTYEELKETLGVTLKEALEFNRQDALTAAGSGYKEEKFAV